VSAWRRGGYVGCSRVTERLLRYWSDPGRERKLFFCQIEALETAVYLTEVAAQYGDGWIENELRTENADFNRGLPRLAFKMATGSGKTVVMAMLIAWQALNKLENRQDRRFSDAFLVVTPGITIRDRLRVLLPTDPSNYYRERDLLPPGLLERLGQAAIVITNYHGFLLRERGEAARLTKSILTKGETNPFVETPDQMVRRVCRELAGKKNLWC
jgi:type III restriction enzyme